MTLEERANLVLACTRLLYINGQSTDETLAAGQRLGGALGLGAAIIARWGELELQADDGNSRLVTAVALPIRCVCSCARTCPFTRPDAAARDPANGGRPVMVGGSSFRLTQGVTGETIGASRTL